MLEYGSLVLLFLGGLALSILYFGFGISPLALLRHSHDPERYRLPVPPTRPGSTPMPSPSVPPIVAPAPPPPSASPAPLVATLPTMTVTRLAHEDNVLIVGQKGAGKTTLLRTLLHYRRDGERLALDPHTSPGKWGCDTIGGGRKYAVIGAVLQQLDAAMTTRAEEIATGTVREGDHPRRSLVSDEFRSINQQVAKMLKGDRELYKGWLTPGDVLLARISEGRKFGECALIAAHNDTVSALGIQGDADMKTCFDAIVYLGGMLRRAAAHGCPGPLLETARQTERPAVVWHPADDSWSLLVRDVPALQIHEAPAAAPAPSFVSAPTLSGPVERAGNFSTGPETFPPLETGFQALESVLPLSMNDFSSAEIAAISAQIAAGKTQTEIVQAMPRYTGRRHKEYVSVYQQLREAALVAV